MRRLLPLTFLAVIAGCGGYTGDRTPEISSSGFGSNGMGGANSRSEPSKSTPAVSSDGAMYAFRNGDTTEIRMVAASGESDRAMGALSESIPAAYAEPRGRGFIFAWHDKPGELFGIYRHSALMRDGATELIPPTFTQVSSIQAANDGKVVVLLGAKKDDPANLFHLPKGTRLPVSVGTFDAFALAPNGDTVAVAQKGVLGLLSLKTKKVTPLGKEPISGAEVAWSPDGKKLAFSANPSGKSYDIFVVNKDGKEKVCLTPTADVEERSPAFSNDGKRVLYTILEKGVAKGVYQLALNSKEAKASEVKIVAASKPTIRGLGATPAEGKAGDPKLTTPIPPTSGGGNAGVTP